MRATCQFEADARIEYNNAIRYYADKIEDADLATRFVEAVELAASTICAAPERWRIVTPKHVRRYVLQRFPFVLFYCYDSAESLVTIYAVMHTSRQPDYWHERLPPSL